MKKSKSRSKTRNLSRNTYDDNRRVQLSTEQIRIEENRSLQTISINVPPKYELEKRRIKAGSKLYQRFGSPQLISLMREDGQTNKHFTKKVRDFIDFTSSSSFKRNHLNGVRRSLSKSNQIKKGPV